MMKENVNPLPAAKKIEIFPYNPAWPAMFEAEKSRLISVLGDSALKIEHMGSTAVPGLGAKPVIDIMIAVATLAIADARCVGAIQTLGYEYVSEFETIMPFRRFFRRDDEAGVRTHHIHLVEITHDFWRRQLLFRDYLRAHADARADYERLKRSLAPQFTDMNEYANAKSDFILAAEAKAAVWAQTRA